MGAANVAIYASLLVVHWLTPWPLLSWLRRLLARAFTPRAKAGASANASAASAARGSREALLTPGPERMPQAWLRRLSLAQRLTDVHLDLPMLLPAQWVALTDALAALPDISSLAVHDAALPLGVPHSHLLGLTRLAGKLQELDLTFVRHTVLGRGVGGRGAAERTFEALRAGFKGRGDVHCEFKVQGSGGHGSSGAQEDGGEGGGGMQPAELIAAIMAGGNNGGAAAGDGGGGGGGAGGGNAGGAGGGAPLPGGAAAGGAMPMPMDEASGSEDEDEGGGGGGPANPGLDTSTGKKGPAEDTDELFDLRSQRSWVFGGVAGVLGALSLSLWVCAGCRLMSAVAA